MKKLWLKVKIMVDKFRAISLKVKLLAFVVIAVGVLSALTGLFVLSPQITISQIKPEQITLQQDTINSQSSYPFLQFASEHLVTFQNGKQIVAKSYQSLVEDYSEGENVITARKVLNLKVASLVSADEVQVKVNVDRIAPEATFSSNTTPYIVLADAEVTVTSEPGAKVLSGDQEVALLESAEQKLNLKLADGTNEFKLAVVDPAGNKSKETLLKFDAFKKEGYALHNCGKLQFPLDNANLKVVSSQCNHAKANFAIDITPHKFARCNVGDCDISDNYITFGVPYHTKTYADTIKWLTQGDYKYIHNKDYTNRVGLTGRLIEFDGGETYIKYFVFELDGKAYWIFAYDFVKLSTTRDARFMEIVDNLKVI